MKLFIDFNNVEASIDGTLVRLTMGECQVLEALRSAYPTRLFNHEIAAATEGRVRPDSIGTLVKRIRDKTKLNISVRYGNGYRLEMELDGSEQDAGQEAQTTKQGGDSGPRRVLRG